MWNKANAELDRRIVSLLDVDPDLGADLEPEMFSSAMDDLRAPVVALAWERNHNRWGPADPQGHLGLLIVQGLLLREVRLLGSASAEVLGEGDLIRPWGVNGESTLPVPAQIWWTVLARCEVAVLNPRFVRLAGRWPEVLARLTGRAVTRAQALGLHDAVTNLKHVEARLLVQFWHLAERWGRVDPEGISIDVPLTHEMLAKLVGATRPSVTTALGHLAARGLLVRGPEGVWRLDPDARESLEPMPVQPDTRLAS